jgi:hypothetical protein
VGVCNAVASLSTANKRLRYDADALLSGSGRQPPCEEIGRPIVACSRALVLASQVAFLSS